MNQLHCQLYWSTFQHVSPYYLGVLVGYIVHKHQTFEINRFIELTIWTVTLLSGLGTIFWTTHWMDSLASEESPDRFHRLLFTAVHKTTWTVLPAWIILANAFGRPGLSE